MKHKRLHKRLVQILETEGDLRTGQILDELCSTQTNPKTASRNNFYKQPVRVVVNVLKRKPILKIGFDASAKQAVWGIRDSE